ncbi:MAG: hypothetical protein IH801_04230 [Nitrospinae bacterium]|nr:hypothetical protein [Nitrospinota bacterium]MCH7767669.1 hypothetical protein [Nitrospinota bacterium]
MGKLDERKRKKETLRKAYRNLVFGFSFIGGATTVLLTRKVQGLEDFDYAFGIVVGAIIYVFLKKFAAQKGGY